MKLIERATAAIVEGDLAGALGHALAAWRDHPSERMAAVVERISDLAEAPRPKVPGDTAKARLANALALLAAGDPVDVPRVMRALVDVKLSEALALATALGELPRDPRYLRQMIALLLAQPWGMSTSRALWRVLFANLVAHADPRSRAQLDALDFVKILGGADWASDQMIATVARWHRQLTATAPAPTPAIEAACAKLDAALGAGVGQGTELLDAIYANPRDLGPRAIYADWLLERDDPRGELITLQMTPVPTVEQKRRERELLAEHGDEWLGPLAPACDERRRFANGFLVEAVVDPDRAAVVKDAAEWHTVEAIWFRQRAEASEFPWDLVRSPAMTALAFVGGLDESHVHAIANAPWAIHRLGFELPDYRGKLSAAQRKALDALVPMKLHEVALGPAAPAVIRPLWPTLLAHTTRLRVESGLASVPAWMAERLPAQLARVEISFDHGWHGWTIALARGAGGKFSRMVATLRPAQRSNASCKLTDLVANVLDEIAPDALEHFELRLEGATATKADHAALAGALARQTRLGATGARPAKKLKDEKAAAATAAADASRAALDAALARLATPCPALAAVDHTRPEAVVALRAIADGKTLDPAWGDVAFALLALGPRRDRSGIHELAIRILGRLTPVGAVGRAIAILEAGAAQALEYDLMMIPTAELPTLFDWFETRRGDKAPPRADLIYYAVRDVAGKHGDAATKLELQRRLNKPKLLRFVAYAYEHAIKGITR